jgi:hypothetical protein
MIIIIMKGENFVAHLDGIDGTPVCHGKPVAHHCSIPITEPCILQYKNMITSFVSYVNEFALYFGASF